MPTTQSAIPAVERILAKIVKTDDGCWEYTGAKGSTGYGQIRTVVPGVPTTDRVRRYATREVHRVLFEAVHGPVARDEMVVRSCKTFGCVNPEHLWAKRTAAPVGRVTRSLPAAA
jgi:hypothetical protein